MPYWKRKRIDNSPSLPCLDCCWGAYLHTQFVVMTYTGGGSFERHESTPSNWNFDDLENNYPRETDFQVVKLGSEDDNSNYLLMRIPLKLGHGYTVNLAYSICRYVSALRNVNVACHYDNWQQIVSPCTVWCCAELRGYKIHILLPRNYISKCVANAVGTGNIIHTLLREVGCGKQK